MTSAATQTQPRRGRPATAAARVLAATARLLEAGERFTDIPVERLLDEAQVSRSAFYAHFPDKTALLLRLAEGTIAELSASAQIWWQDTHNLGPERAAATLRDLIRLHREHAPVINCLVEVAAYDDTVRDLWRNAREVFAAHVAAGLRTEQERGFVPADLDIDRTASYVVLLVNTALTDHVAHGSPRDDQQVAAALARMGWLAYYGTIDETAA